MEAARTGNRSAFAAIYDRYADRIHDFAASMLRDRHEAADVLQETFLAAAEHLGELRSPEKLRPWLYAIARHQALTQLRGRRRVVPLPEVPEMPDEAPGDMRPPGYSEEDLTRLVAEAAAGLPERDRLVLDLHVRHDLAGQDLAEALGVSESNAGALLHRVKDRFERSVSAFLLARTAQGECAELTTLLEGWEGTLTPLLRKRVARHLEECEICGERKKTLVRPLAALAAMPLVPAPAWARDQVLAAAKLPGEVKVEAFGGTDGFPPGMKSAHPRRRYRRALLAASALLAVVASVVSYQVVGGGEPGNGTPSAAPTSAPTTVASAAPTSSAGAIEPATTRGTMVAPASSSPLEPTVPPPTTSSTAALTTSSTAAPTTSSTAAPSTSSTSTTAPTTTTAAASTTTTADGTGPTLGAITASPDSIHEDGSAGCSDTTTTVTVSAEDPSGVSSVTLQWQVGSESGSAGMSPSGQTWAVTIGPFPDNTLPFGTSSAIDLTVTAVDGLGNSSSTASGNSLQLIDCTFG